MKKAEFIERYGEEAWKRQLEAQLASSRKRGGYADRKDIYLKNKRDGKLVDNFTCKVSIPVPKIEVEVEKGELKGYIRMVGEEMASVIQKDLRVEWNSKTRQKHILIVDLMAMSNNTFKFRCELTQLRMDKDTINEFETLCKDRILFLSK